MTFTEWILNIARPRLRYMYVKIYENGVPKPISFYNQEKRELLRQSIESLLELPKESIYKFQCHIQTERSCFHPPITYLQVCCLKEGTLIDIPVRYRKKLFDRFHEIHPASGKWLSQMEIKFVTVERRHG